MQFNLVYTGKVWFLGQALVHQHWQDGGEGKDLSVVQSLARSYSSAVQDTSLREFFTILLKGALYYVQRWLGFLLFSANTTIPA